LREGFRRFHVILDAGETLEIAVDEALRLGPRDAQVARKAEAGNAVDHAEIDRLGLTADHRVIWSSGTPNISDAVMAWMSMPLAERLFQRGIPAIWARMRNSIWE
jgi:hypothetical protein